MKLKTGDKVKIVSLNTTKECLNVDETMEELLGKTVTIQCISIKSCFLAGYVYRANDYDFHEDDLQLITTDLEIE